MALNYLQANPGKLLVVVDAIDEVEDEGDLLREGSVFSQLLGRSPSPHCHLDKASVVLASRQCRLVDESLGRLCSRHYYLLGFNRQSLEELFLQCLDDHELKEKLLQLLDQPRYEQLREAIMEMPLLAAMVAMLWEESAGQLPSKINEIYKRMLDKLMDKVSRPSHAGPGRESHRPTRHRFVNHLSHLALDCLRRRSYTLSNDAGLVGGPDLTIAVRSCILIPNQPTVSANDTYRFSHFTWMEYLAARAIAMRDDFISKAGELARESMAPSMSTQLFWLFLAGQVGHNQIAVLLQTLRSVATEHGAFSAETRIFLMHCMHEWLKSGEPDVCTPPALDEELRKDLVAAVRSDSKLFDRIDLNGHSMASKDVRVLADILRHLHVPVLSLGCCALAEEHLTILSGGVSHLTRLTLAQIDLRDLQLQQLVQHLHELESFRLHFCIVDQTHGDGLSIVLKNNTHLDDLELIGNEGLGYGGLTRLCDGIDEDCSLKRILLNGSGLGDRFDGEYVGSMLSKAKELQTICFTRNGFTSKHLKTVLPHLAKLQKLQEIWLRYNNIDDSALTAIADFFRERCEQRRKTGDASPSAREGAADRGPEKKVASVVIHLDHNPLGTNKKLEQLARSMREMETASDEVVWNCRSVTSHGVRCVNFDGRDYTLSRKRSGRAWLNDRGLDDEALTKYIVTKMAKDEEIKFLMLDGNMISDSGAVTLARYLSTDGKHLELLCLSTNRISNKGFEAIVRALTKHPLRVLTLADNPIFGAVDPGKASLCQKILCQKFLPFQYRPTIVACGATINHSLYCIVQQECFSRYLTFFKD